MAKLFPALLLLLLAAPAAAQEESTSEAASSAKPAVQVRNSLGVGTVLDFPHWGYVGVELLLSDRLRVDIATPNAHTTVFFAGRMGIRPIEGAADRVRIRALGVRVDTGTLRFELGRSAVIDGGWRLVDGVQVLARPRGERGRLEVGGWLGEVPDLWTTAPAPRFGAGPIVRWRGRRFQLGFVGEVAGGALGVERVAARATGRFEWKKLLDVDARAEIEAGGQGAPVRFSELGLGVTVTPLPWLRTRVAYSMHGGHSWLQGIQRDPSLTRWVQRTTGADPTEPLPWQTATDGPTHQVLGTVTAEPRVGAVGLRLAGRARYNHRAEARERSARFAFEGGVRDLLGGRLDVMGTGGALLWGGSWRGELGLRTWFGPDPKGILNLELEGRTWLERTPSKLIPTFAADLWADVLLPVGLSVAIGYRFDTDLDIDRWNAAHTVLARVTWRLRVPGSRSTKRRAARDMDTP